MLKRDAQNYIKITEALDFVGWSKQASSLNDTLTAGNCVAGNVNTNPTIIFHVSGTISVFYLWGLSSISMATVLWQMNLNSFWNFFFTFVYIFKSWSSYLIWKNTCKSNLKPVDDILFFNFTQTIKVKIKYVCKLVLKIKFYFRN